MANKKSIYIASVVDVGATKFACEYLRYFELNQITEIKLTPASFNKVIVSFYFETSPDLFMQIDILNGFCVGYHGEGPQGLYDIMIDAGFSEHTASRVFEISRYAETVLTKEVQVSQKVKLLCLTFQQFTTKEW